VELQPLRFWIKKNRAIPEHGEMAEIFERGSKKNKSQLPPKLQVRGKLGGFEEKNGRMPEEDEQWKRVPSWEGTEYLLDPLRAGPPRVIQRKEGEEKRRELGGEKLYEEKNTKEERVDYPHPDENGG